MNQETAAALTDTTNDAPSTEEIQMDTNGDGVVDEPGNNSRRHNRNEVLDDRNTTEALMNKYQDGYQW